MSSFNFEDLSNEDGLPEIPQVPRPMINGVPQELPEHVQKAHDERVEQARKKYEQDEEEAARLFAERKILTDSRLAARSITSLSNAYNSTPDGVRKTCVALPTTDRELVTLLSQMFLSNYIFIPTSASSGFWYVWDGTMYVKQNDRKFTAHLTAGCQEFMKELVKGYYKVLAHNDIEMPKEEKKKVGRPKKDAEPEVELSPEAQKIADRDAFIIEKFRQVRELADKMGNQFMHYHVANALEDIRHKPGDYFINDARYIVDVNGKVMDTNNLCGGIMEPDPRRPVARKLNVAFDGIVKKPGEWQKYLDTWFPNDPDTQRYLQVALGAAILGRGDTRHIPSLFGERRTGKSTFVKIFMDLFGGYAKKVNREFIAQKSGTNFMRSQAQGVRFLLLEETDKFDLADNGFMKELAGGGGTLTTERKGVDAEEWPIQCVLFIATNFRIKVDVSDDAIMERVNYVEFKHQFKEEDADTVFALDKYLVENCGPEILQWALEGAKYWARPEVNSFPKSDAIRAQEGKAKLDGSSVIEWFTTACESPIHIPASGQSYQLRIVGDEVATSACAKRSEVYNYYKQWSIMEGYDKPVGPRVFADHMTSQIPGGAIVRSNGQRIKGLVLSHVGAQQFTF